MGISPRLNTEISLSYRSVVIYPLPFFRLLHLPQSSSSTSSSSFTMSSSSITWTLIFQVKRNHKAWRASSVRPYLHGFGGVDALGDGGDRGGDADVVHDRQLRVRETQHVLEPGAYTRPLLSST